MIEISEILIAMERRLAAIEHHLAANHGATARRPLAPVDLEVLRVVLPPLSAGLGRRGRVFSVRDLLEHFELSDPAALDRLRELLGNDPGRRLGKVLARAADAVVDCVLLQRIGSARGAALWMVRPAE